ncbi:hypothetical protein AVEN_244500-1, partial [Araneus ventricosus]
PLLFAGWASTGKSSRINSGSGKRGWWKERFIDICCLFRDRARLPFSSVLVKIEQLLRNSDFTSCDSRRRKNYLQWTNRLPEADDELKWMSDKITFDYRKSRKFNDLGV